MARTDWQRFVRALTPLRRFQCLDCKRRGWILGSLPQAGQPSTGLDLPARPVEDRDVEELADSRFRFVVRLVVAISLGALFALWLVSQTPH